MKEDPLSATLRNAGLVLACATNFVGSVLVLGLLGSWLDRQFATGGWGMPLGVFAGVVLGSVELWFLNRWLRWPTNARKDKP